MILSYNVGAIYLYDRATVKRKEVESNEMVT